MRTEEVQACAFPAWYDKFKKCTIKSLVLPLEPDVLAYMQDNGTLVLPEGSQVQYTHDPDDDPDDDWDNTGSAGSSVQEPKLEEFTAKVNDAIKKLGGSVFPKLNWSSPKDASWISLNKTLRCSTPGDVYLLLKSSNFVAHDLTCPFKTCSDHQGDKVDYCFVLRKWLEINPSNEFRCFVRNKTLTGICQRDVSQSYSCIGADQPNICSDIVSFWRENIENRFPLTNYTFDVFRPAKDHVVLIDFNPFGDPTDSLLFSWDELREKKENVQDINRTIEDIAEEDEYGECDVIERNDTNRRIDAEDDDASPEFRFISDATGVQPSPYMQYGLPTDIVDLSSGQDPHKLIDFLQMKIQSEANESSDDDGTS